MHKPGHPKAASPGPPEIEQSWRSLHLINQAFLAAGEEEQIARALLKFMPNLLPGLDFARVYRVQPHGRALIPLAEQSYQLEISEDQARPELMPDPGEIFSWSAGEVYSNGVDQFLPVWAEGELTGLIQFRLVDGGPLQTSSLEVLEQAAQSLALALLAIQRWQHTGNQRHEAELMRDIMGALASSADLNQSLETILVNLRNLVNYDQARLFLLENTLQGATAGYFGEDSQQGKGMFSPSDPVVAELRLLQQPVIIGDISRDPRFRSWPEMETVRGWLGVPIFAGEEMVGFLSLGSLKIDCFQPQDAELVNIFGAQLGHILERAWLHEQSHRQSEELEVLSKITFALGQVDNEESIFPAILEQVARFYGAVGGTFLFPDHLQTSLYVRYSNDPALIGMHLPGGEDLFWKVFQTGERRILKKIPGFLKRNPAEPYQRLLGSSGSAAIIPLAYRSSNFGVLLLLFDEPGAVLVDNLEQLDTIASITGTFLYRAIFLDALEKQLHIRTRHLTALYSLNQVAGQSTDDDQLLGSLLKIVLEVMGSEMGFILLGDADGQVLGLAAQYQISDDIRQYFTEMQIQKTFWEEVLSSNSPLVVPNISEEPRLPAVFKQMDWRGQNACILAPLRARHQTLGLVGIFNVSVLDYSIEDINLFMNITDQLGNAVERANLAAQARQAAVIEERQRLARELHDSVTQLIYSQVLFAGAGLRVLDQGDLETLRYDLGRIDEAAQQALKEMRLLVYELRPAVYLQEGLVAALERRLDAVEKRGGINATLRVEGDLGLDEALELSLYRIIEEALNNTLKHSSAKNVSIYIDAQPNSLRLEIHDDGSGFDPVEMANLGGMGLHNIRERTEALGGKIAIETGPNEGTRLMITIGVN